MEPTKTYNILIDGKMIEELSGILERRQALLIAAMRWEKNKTVIVMAISSDGDLVKERTITGDGEFK